MIGTTTFGITAINPQQSSRFSDYLSHKKVVRKYFEIQIFLDLTDKDFHSRCDDKRNKSNINLEEESLNDKNNKK